MDPIKHTLKEYGRGLGGGLLFSLPMLYTMELWSTGFLAGPVRLLIYLAVGLGLLVGYNQFVGLSGNHTLAESIYEAVEEMGMGLIVSAIILWLIGILKPGMSKQEIIGKIVVESLTVAIGISIGKSQLGNNDNEYEDINNDKERNHSATVNFHAQLAIAFCGAILIASNVAPTEEILVIALRAGSINLILIALFSMGIGGAILYFSNFTGSHESVAEPQCRTDIMAGIVIMYTVALVVSAFMLWFFGRLDGLSLNVMVSEIVVLSFPGALGASAGRLLLQS